MHSCSPMKTGSYPDLSQGMNLDQQVLEVIVRGPIINIFQIVFIDVLILNYKNMLFLITKGLS